MENNYLAVPVTWFFKNWCLHDENKPSSNTYCARQADIFRTASLLFCQKLHTHSERCMPQVPADVQMQSHTLSVLR